MKSRIFIVQIIFLLFISCIEEYTLPNNASDNYQKELVIQGRILAGDVSTVHISYTQPFGSNSGINALSDAQVTIIGQNGYQSKVGQYDELNKQYMVDTSELPNNTLYALKVEVGREIYQSDFLKMQTPPEIDKITYQEQEDGISLHVTTYGEDNSSPYYMWTYEEDWEFHAEIDMLRMGGIPLYNKEIYTFNNSQDNPYYYCWGHNTSKNIHIYSTKNLDTNTVKEVELLRIPIDDVRISYIYSILVKQWTLSEKAYNYYQTMEILTENTGELFSPMPSEIIGNVKCTSNPQIKIRGYVIAAQITTKRFFIYESELESIKSEYSECKISRPPLHTMGWDISWTYQVNKYGYLIYTQHGEIDAESILYSNTCVDCRAVEGSTKQRPYFWPNNHK